MEQRTFLGVQGYNNIIFKNMKKLLILAIAATTIAACNNKQAKHNIKKISWIEGEWEMNINNYTFKESWNKTSDSTYKGSGVLVDSVGNSVFNEQLYIVERDDTLWYQPTVSNQNNQREISYKMTHLSDDSVVFENPLHDFPQVITYVKTSDTSIHAFVSGYSNGEPRQDDFFFTKGR